MANWWTLPAKMELSCTGAWLVSRVILNLLVLAGEEGTHTRARGRLNVAWRTFGTPEQEKHLKANSKPLVNIGLITASTDVGYPLNTTLIYTYIERLKNPGTSLNCSFKLFKLQQCERIKGQRDFNYKMFHLIPHNYCRQTLSFSYL